MIIKGMDEFYQKLVWFRIYKFPMNNPHSLEKIITDGRVRPKVWKHLVKKGYINPVDSIFDNKSPNKWKFSFNDKGFEGDGVEEAELLDSHFRSNSIAKNNIGEDIPYQVLEHMSMESGQMKHLFHNPKYKFYIGKQQDHKFNSLTGHVYFFSNIIGPFTFMEALEQQKSLEASDTTISYDLLASSDAYVEYFNEEQYKKNNLRYQ